MVASSAPLDPSCAASDYFSNTPEHAYIQPDNGVLINHLKCAAFELPIAPEDNSTRRTPGDYVRGWLGRVVVSYRKHITGRSGRIDEHSELALATSDTSSLLTSPGSRSN
jgi:hypothetical protein